jgi:hypothetical protein
MSTITVASKEQGRIVGDLVRWFDYESSSLHHALIMAAERNESDAAEVAEAHPAVAEVLRQSGASWRKHAARVMELSEALGDTDEIDTH